METATKKPARTAVNGTGRTRAYYGYSRNGCARCKQQRVRCDERHPECDRCVRVGVQCPGYEQKLRWSAKHEVFRPDQGQKKQQARRKQAEKSDALVSTAQPVPSPTDIAQPMQVPEFSVFHQQQQQPQVQQQPQHQITTPRSLPSPSSTVGIQQQPLPSPNGTGTSATSPTTQFTSNTGSPEPEPIFPQTAPLNGDHAGHPRNPSWPNVFDQFAAPMPDSSDFYMGMSNPFSAAQKAMDAGAMFHSNMMASAGLDGSWASGLSAGANIAMPNMIPTAQQTNTAPPSMSTNQTDSIEFIPRTSDFPRRAPMGQSMGGFMPIQSDGLDMLLRGGRWAPRLQNQTNLSFEASTRASYTAELQTDRESDDSANEATFNSDGTRMPLVSPASKALQLVSVPTRQASPSLSTVSLNDFSTVLVEFYFKVTAQVYSCYDSRMNPFRSTVVRTWSSSRIIYCTLQSMAAASLIRDFPEVAPIGRQLRQEAADLLAKTTNWDINSMLAILMLGGTSSWHNPRDLGLPFFNQIAACLATAPASAFGEDGGHRSYRFFRESMLYWEMLLAFVADNDTISTVPDERPDPADGSMGPESIPGPRIPHPWTGFCAETQLAVLKVGRLIRRQRKFDYAHRFASMAHINQLKKDMSTARELEERLVNISHPTEQSVQDTEDRNTPVWHLLTLAEIIRDTGLVQLYHVFPDLLTARLRRERRGENGDYSHLGASFQDDNAAPSDPQITQEERSKWLTSYTLQSLDKMKTIPIESGTRDFQPFLLVALCSELRINKKRRPGTQRNAGPMGANLPLHTLLNLDMETVEVTRARGFIHSRLTAFLHALPPKPILACLDIVKQTWVEMDCQAETRAKSAADGINIEGEADVYWMDVMIQNGWETIMA
ncbi:hypothetical protein SEUCBS139899_003977 [Sporothrix eucalyptigena]|uniref:Zn(2)-C6 fungal-type domain-containing protein n=1 Tax=Sporothrix eucalyptigena TaxID=1812306 RepID=A0ABP0AM55_9PEZI